jgi:secreted trypsin-like serine protease
LIDRNTVLTAAHCVSTIYGRARRASRFHFALDDDVHNVTRVRIARGYNPYALDDQCDIAKVELASESMTIEPIPIATSPPELNRATDVIGFGVTRATGPQEGTGGGARRRTRVRLAHIERREVDYDAAERGACYGDSGGPLLQNLGDGPVIIGVTSRGTGVYCDGIGIATRVDSFREWIEN